MPQLSILPQNCLFSGTQPNLFQFQVDSGIQTLWIHVNQVWVYPKLALTQWTNVGISLNSTFLYFWPKSLLFYSLIALNASKQKSNPQNTLFLLITHQNMMKNSFKAFILQLLFAWQLILANLCSFGLNVWWWAFDIFACQHFWTLTSHKSVNEGLPSQGTNTCLKSKIIKVLEVN